MELKILALLLVASLLVQVPASPVKPTQEELINKKVSVNLPKRVAYPVSHFDPVGHHYTAEASVIINRVVPSVDTFKPPKIEIPEPPKNLAKKLLIRSPEKSYSQNRHFDPALHDYEAEGLVLINLDSPLLTTQQHIFEPSHDLSLEGKPKNPIVKKTVVVKSPHGSIPVISHFHPAPHIYAAVGDVLIDKTASNAYERGDSDQTSNFLSADEREISSSQRVNVFSDKPLEQYATRESVRKSVTVELPEHRISNINHFNPAGHKYAATGEVNIDRENLSNQEHYRNEDHQAPRTTSHHSNKRRAVDTPPSISEARDKNIRIPSPSIQNRVHLKPTSGFSIKKKVSVELPEHRISHINHFNPAGHRYAAHGGVEIDRKLIEETSNKKRVTPAKKSVVTKSTSQNLKPSQSYLVPLENPIKFEQRVQDPLVSSPIQPPLKTSPSIFSVKKEVSVQLPEHRISHINHFNPAGHRYAAEGGVKIDRTSSLAPQGVAQTPRRPSKPDVNIFKTSPRQPVQVQVKQPAVKPVIQRTVVSTTPKRTQTFRIDNDDDKAVKVPFLSTRRQPSLKPGSPSLAVKKAVSVQLPEHRISHINHFNPAGHRYAAEGGVEIDRASLAPHGVAQTPRRPSKPDVNIFKTSPRQPVQVQVKQPAVKPVIQRTVVSTTPKRTQPSRVPQRRVDYDDDDKVVKVPFQSTRRQPSLKPGSPSLAVKKAVSVQLPEHRISHINHFNPAGHRYAAEGGVEIDRASSLGPLGVAQTPRRPSKPDVNIFKTSPRQPVQVQVKQPAVKPVIQRTVVSKSPLRTQKPSAIGGIEVDKDVPSIPAVTRVVQKKPIITRVSTFTPKLSQPPRIAPKPSSAKPADSKTSIAPAPKLVPTIRQPQRPIDAKDRIVQVSSKDTSRRPLFEASAPGLFVKKEVSVHLPEHKISHISHFNPAGHKYDAHGGVEISGKKPLKPSVTSPVIKTPVKLGLNVVKTSLPESSPDSDGGFSSLTSDFDTIPAKPSPPSTPIDILLPAVSLPKRGPVSDKKDTSSQSGISSTELLDDNVGQKPAFDFGPAGSYDFSDIASYLPPVPDISQVSAKKINVQTSPQSPVSLPGSSRFQLNKEVSVQSPDHSSSTIAHFSPAVPKYKASNRVVINGDN